MTDNPIPPHNPARRTGDIDPFSGGWQEPPKPRSRAVAKHSLLSRRENSRHPSSTASDAPNTDDIDAAKDLMKMPSPKSSVDCPVAHPKLSQLPPSHRPVLPLRKPRHRVVPLTSR